MMMMMMSVGPGGGRFVMWYGSMFVGHETQEGVVKVLCIGFRECDVMITVLLFILW